jgi:ribosome-binding factor A
MAEQAREKLGYIMLFEISDPALDLVTLTGCEVSIDKSVLRAYVSCDAARYDEVQVALDRARGRIRSLLGKALGWRLTPELVFVIDTTVDEAAHIATLLEDVPESMNIEKDEFGYPLQKEMPEDVDE